MPDLQQEATALLQRLVRHDTVNPPGDERPLQEELAALLRGAGFEVELLGRTEPRPNLVARLRGRADGPTLCLLSHVDTVLAHAEEWQRDPWSGDVVDGERLGPRRDRHEVPDGGRGGRRDRRWPARAGARRGDLLVVVVVDEEVGGDGRRDLAHASTTPTWCAATSCSTRARASVIPFDGRRVYGVCVAEKGVFRFTRHTEGVGRPRVDARDRRQRAAEDGAAARGDDGRRAPGST